MEIGRLVCTSRVGTDGDPWFLSSHGEVKSTVGQGGLGETEIDALLKSLRILYIYWENQAILIGCGNKPSGELRI